MSATTNTHGALYFVAFFSVLMLELKQFLGYLTIPWAILELSLYLLFGGIAILLIPFVYLNYPDMAGWMIMLLALNLVNMAFLFTLLPFSWSYLALFAFGFWGLVAGVPFQMGQYAKKKRIVQLMRLIKPPQKKKPA